MLSREASGMLSREPSGMLSREPRSSTDCGPGGGGTLESLTTSEKANPMIAPSGSSWIQTIRAGLGASSPRSTSSSRPSSSSLESDMTSSAPSMLAASAIARTPPRETLSAQPSTETWSPPGPAPRTNLTRSVASRRAPPLPLRWGRRPGILAAVGVKLRRLTAGEHSTPRGQSLFWRNDGRTIAVFDHRRGVLVRARRAERPRKPRPHPGTLRDSEARPPRRHAKRRGPFVRESSVPRRIPL